MTKDEALKLALEALLDNRHYIVEHESAAYLEIYDESITAVEKALAEQPAQQEPDVDRLVALARADEREDILRMSYAQWFKSQSAYDEAIKARGEKT